MNRRAAVILDMDGLLLDTEPIYREASRAAAAELGHAIDDALYAALVGRGVAEVEAALYAALGPQFPMSRFRERWQVHWRRIVDSDGIRLKAGVLDLLEALQAAAVPFAVATSTHAARARACLEVAGVGARLRHLLCGDQVARGKPAPDIYLAAAALLEVTPRSCVALEDSEAGVLAAAAAGMRTVLVPDLGPPTPAAAAAAWRIVPSLVEARPLVLTAMAAARAHEPAPPAR